MKLPHDSGTFEAVNVGGPGLTERMQTHQSAFAKAPTADTASASDAGLGAGFGSGPGTNPIAEPGAGSSSAPGANSSPSTSTNTNTNTNYSAGASASASRDSSAPNGPSAGEIVAPTLAAIVEALVAVRAQIHTLHAVEATLLSLGDSIAEEVAVREHHTDHGESEHRALAAELAAAVHESDRTMAGRIARAVTLVQDYPTVHDALQQGHISQIHANLITDAGTVITDDTARARYAAAALEIAQQETPGRVRSLVKELAERFANRTLDERHQEARTCRMVRVVELGDGMADLTATLPAVYAYGIKDRLNQIARGVKQHEQALADETKKSGSSGVSAGSPSNASSASANPADEPHHAPRIVRSMDQIRADLLTDMLLATDPNDAALSGFTGITGLRARVQVIVPKARLGANETTPDPEPESEPTAETQPDTTTEAGFNAETPSGKTQAKTWAASTDTATDAKVETGTGTDSSSRTSTRSTPTSPTSAPTTAPAPAPAPATLAGYGPIDTHTAQQLAGHTTHWEQITINPDTGTVLSVDTYRPNTKLKQFLRARDLHCRFPGCHTPTVRCDIDHTIDAALGGPTTSTNLAHLCRRHHTLKHHSRWAVAQATDGTLTWTSPLGTPYTERPPSTVKFKPLSVSDPPPARTEEPTCSEETSPF